jgi:hypothetical protein
MVNKAEECKRDNFHILTHDNVFSNRNKGGVNKEVARF